MKKSLASCLIAMFRGFGSGTENTVKVGHDVQTLGGPGVDAVMTNCHSCHSLKYITYRDLVVAGVDAKKVDAWRGDQPLSAPYF